MSRPINMAKDVALTGLGVRLPGPDGEPVRGPAHLWQMLLSGDSALGRYPQERWERMAEGLHPADRPEYPWPVAPLEAPAAIDHETLGLSAAEAAHYSPTQRLILEAGVEAVEDAGLDPASLAGPGTGLYVGNASPDEAVQTFASGARPSFAGLSAGGAGMLATPLSRLFDTHGPLLTMDTSCSSALYALDAGARDVADGRVDTAVVIGVNTARTPAVGRAFADGPVLASQISRPFDRKADGFVRGEGIVVAVLRRYGTARRERDRIYATVAATRTGADGRSPGTGMPSVDAQAQLWERTLSGAGIHPDEVDYVQAHGTATRAGDGAEARALGRAFTRTEEHPLWVGSTKGAFGHSEGAAGLVGVAAAALSLYYGRIPPTAGHRTPSPLVERHHLRVPTRAIDWPEKRVCAPRHAGVSSLGFSGGIACAVLRQAPPARPDDEHDQAADPVQVLALSARDRAGLAEQAERLHTAVTGPQAPSPAHLAAHLARRTDQQGPWRAAVVCSPDAAAGSALHALSQGQTHPDLSGPAREQGGRQVWAFGGHGAAHPGMGARLYEADALFARHMDRARAALAEHTRAPWHPLQGLPQGLARTQQATWAMQVAVAATLTERWSLVPDAVVGHSLGEVAAAHVAGALDLVQAARLVVARSQLLERVAPGGGMVSVEADAHVVAELAQEHGVEVAATNAPRLHVLSGARDRVCAAQVEAARAGYVTRILRGAPPAHSRAVEPALDELGQRLEGLVAKAPRIEMVSTVTAAPVADLSAHYWVRQLRAPVDFEAAVVGLAGRGPVLLGELSPHPVLAVPTAQSGARHHLPLQVATLGSSDHDEVQGPARLAAWAHTHGLSPEQGYVPHPPVELGPRTWRQRPPVDWPTELSGLDAEQVRARVADWVHRQVAELSSLTVGPAERDRPLEDLGLNSMSRLTLRTHVLSRLGVQATGAAEVEHAPTINGITDALTVLVRSQEPTESAGTDGTDTPTDP